MLFVLVLAVVEVEELIPIILALSSETMEVLVVAVAFIVFEVFCLLCLLLVMLWWGRKALMELVILVILLTQLTVETAARRLSTELLAVRQGVRAEKELSRTRLQSLPRPTAEMAVSETVRLPEEERPEERQELLLPLVLAHQELKVKTERFSRT
jgi:hypothetical protein